MYIDIPVTDERVEEVAKELHEAGRAAVEAGLVINKVPGQPFFEWDQITEQAREGRRVQARYLLSRFVMVPKFSVPSK